MLTLSAGWPSGSHTHSYTCTLQWETRHQHGTDTISLELAALTAKPAPQNEVVNEVAAFLLIENDAVWNHILTNFFTIYCLTFLYRKQYVGDSSKADARLNSDNTSELVLSKHGTVA